MKMKPSNNVTLYDFLVLTSCDYDTEDTEYDAIVTCTCIDSFPENEYEEFYHKMCKKVNVVKSRNNYLTVNWSEMIERNLEKFKTFAKKHWTYTYEDDEDELIYQWINEINAYFAGYVSESFYKTLCEFVDTLE